MLAGAVAPLVFLEFVSGVLQGYYTPLMTDIARHLRVHDADLNWLESSQLMLSALVVPLLAKVGDLAGHRRVLVAVTAFTAGTALLLPVIQSFPLFLAVWALQGVYVVWLPLEIALLWGRTHGADARPALIGRAAGLLIVGLQLGIVAGAVVGGRLSGALPLPLVLLVPGLVVVAGLLVVVLRVPASPPIGRGGLDAVGFALLAAAMLCLMAGFGLLRGGGAASPWPWAAIAASLLLVVAFARWELGRADPFIDVRLFRFSRLGPVYLATALFGMGVLGAQVPLSTFLRTDPAVAGYGLGLGGVGVSGVIVCYLFAMMLGGFAYSRFSALASAPRLLSGAALLIAAGYLLFLAQHDSVGQVLVNMAVIGLGSGVLLAALPSLAVAGASESRSGIVTGVSNSSKMIGGAGASAIFGLILAHGAFSGGSAGTAATAAPLSGYLTVWAVCAAAGLAAAVLLLIVAVRRPTVTTTR